MANSNKPQVNWLQAFSNSGFDPYRNEVIRRFPYPYPKEKRKENTPGHHFHPYPFLYFATEGLLRNNGQVHVKRPITALRPVVVLKMRMNV